MFIGLQTPQNYTYTAPLSQNWHGCLNWYLTDLLTWYSCVISDITMIRRAWNRLHPMVAGYLEVYLGLIIVYLDIVGTEHGQVTAITTSLTTNTEDLVECPESCRCESHTTLMDTVHLHIRCDGVTQGGLALAWRPNVVALMYNISDMTLDNAMPPLTPEMICEASEVRSLTLTKVNVTPTLVQQLTCFLDLVELKIADSFVLLPAIEVVGFNTLKYVTLNSITMRPFDICSVLSYFPSISKLYLSHNAIEIAGCNSSRIFPNLTHIFLNNNSISVVSRNTFSTFPSLAHIDLSHNIIHDGPAIFRTMRGSSVEVLDISNNKLAQINQRWLCDMPKLRAINLNHNSLSSLDISLISPRDYCALERFSLAYNKLVRIDAGAFAGFNHLLYLNISHNSISTIEEGLFSYPAWLPVGSGTDVMYEDGLAGANSSHQRSLMDLIDLSFNNISRLSRQAVENSLSHIRAIYLAHNHITLLPRYGLERLPDLEQIDISHNKLDWLDVGTFKNPNLKVINLSHNKLAKLISMSFLYLPKIQEIDLSHNRLRYLYRYIFYRTCEPGDMLHTVLNLSHNHLQSDAIWKLVSTFKNIEDTYCTVYVDLRVNRIIDLLGEAAETYASHMADGDSGYFSAWDHVYFDVRQNPIHCDCTLYDHAHILMDIGNLFHGNFSLSKNLGFWRHLQCIRPHNLIRMDIESSLPRIVCNVTDACPRRCHCAYVPSQELFIVDCANKRLSKWPSRLPPGNLALNLSGNNILELSNAISAENIVSLDISHNNISKISHELWFRITNIPQLLIHGNYLHKLPLGFLNHPVNTTYLSLSGNPWECGCRTTRFKSWLLNNSAVIADIDRITCLGGHYDGKTIIELPDFQYACTKVTKHAFHDQQVITLTTLLTVFLTIIFIMSVISCYIYNLYKRRIRIYSAPIISPRPLEDMVDGETDVLIYAEIDYMKWTEEHIISKLKSQRPPYTVHMQQLRENRDSLMEDFHIQNGDYHRTLIFIMSMHCGSDVQFTEILDCQTRSRNILVILVEESVADDNTQSSPIHIAEGKPSAQAPHVTYLYYKDRLFYEKLFYILPPPSEKQYLDVTVYNRLLESSPLHYKKF